MRIYLIGSICAVFTTGSLYCDTVTEDTFTKIYDSALWGRDHEGLGTSGDGSNIENAREYVVFLNKFIQMNKIKTIVEMGCGDWQVMRHVDLTGAEYLGVDVVHWLIEKNCEKYCAPNIHFRFADCINDDLPKADLLLIKDVLIHIPHEGIFKIINNFSNYKHILLTTDVEATSLTSSNRDITLGDWRSLDPSAPPFKLEGKKILIYPAEPNYLHFKQVFYIRKE